MARFYQSDSRSSHLTRQANPGKFDESFRAQGLSPFVVELFSQLWESPILLSLLNQDIYPLFSRDGSNTIML